ncbi:MAG: hypothetical protein VX367_13985, partial [SAR324 cluster bacterium]|nr:hypothetical protein [SAR324 cluster bacterium]
MRQLDSVLDDRFLELSVELQRMKSTKVGILNLKLPEARLSAYSFQSFTDQQQKYAFNVTDCTLNETQ